MSGGGGGPTSHWGRSPSRRDIILSSSRRRKCLQMLVEELAKPEIDISEISEHSSMVLNMITKQNVITTLPRIVEHIKTQSEPLVLEISKNHSKEKQKSKFRNRKRSAKVVSPTSTTSKYSEFSQEPFPIKNVKQEVPDFIPMVSQASSGIEDVSVEATGSVDTTPREKQFEIIFSDSLRQDNDNHIIHSTTECTSTNDSSDTVNVPNSFPLFQLVHTGEVPEDVQQEIVRLIRQANPQLDLNSITFNFKSPQTVEIIANVNS